MNKMTKVGVVVLATGTLALGGCTDIEGSVVEKMYIPAYYNTTTQSHIPPCWEIIASGINGGSVCVSKQKYNSVSVGDNFNEEIF